MEYFSTRGSGARISASEAIAQGLAPDGGLFVPAQLPPVTEEALRELLPLGYGARAKRILSMYLPEYSEAELDELVASSYGTNFDTAAIAPTRFTDERTGYLELWHGPTSAFKDMALQMLPHLLTASLKKCGEQRGVCILVATSGDTGKAALEGFATCAARRYSSFTRATASPTCRGCKWSRRRAKTLASAPWRVISTTLRPA